MHRGPNPDYQRASVPPSRYGAPAGPGPAPAPSFTFNRANFPNPVSYPRSSPPRGFQSFSTEPPFQVTLINTLKHVQGCAIFYTIRYNNRPTQYHGLRYITQCDYNCSNMVTLHCLCHYSITLLLRIVTLVCYG